MDVTAVRQRGISTPFEDLGRATRVLTRSDVELGCGFRCRLVVQSDDGDFMSRGILPKFIIIEQNRSAAFDGEYARTGGQHRSERTQPNGRHVETHILLGLRDFHDRDFAFLTEVAGAGCRRRCLLSPRRPTRLDSSRRRFARYRAHPFAWRLPNRIRYRPVVLPSGAAGDLTSSHQ